MSAGEYFGKATDLEEHNLGVKSRGASWRSPPTGLTSMEPKLLQAHELDWGDASFSGCVWENDGKDLRLLLSHTPLPISALSAVGRAT